MCVDPFPSTVETETEENGQIQKETDKSVGCY